MNNTSYMWMASQYLIQLGATPNYSGFHYAAYGIVLAAENPSRLLAVTKELYPEIGRHYHVSWCAAERSIRFLLSILWERDQKLFREISGCSAVKKPSAGEFIAVMAFRVRSV